MTTPLIEATRQWLEQNAKQMEAFLVARNAAHILNIKQPKIQQELPLKMGVTYDSKTIK